MRSLDHELLVTYSTEIRSYRQIIRIADTVLVELLPIPIATVYSPLLTIFIVMLKK